jgi:hypothetical protein
MHTLQVLGKAFFDICRLRLKPQELPYSSVLLGLTLLLYTVTSSVLSAAQVSLLEAVLSSLVETLLLIALVSSLLYMTHYPRRILQTLTALAGANSLLGILSGPPMFWLFYAKLNQMDMTIPLLLLLGLIIWSLVVYAHILHHALEVSFFTGFVLSLMISILIMDASRLLFPLSSQ